MRLAEKETELVDELQSAPSVDPRGTPVPPLRDEDAIISRSKNNFFVNERLCIDPKRIPAYSPGPVGVALLFHACCASISGSG